MPSILPGAGVSTLCMLDINVSKDNNAQGVAKCFIALETHSEYIISSSTRA